MEHGDPQPDIPGPDLEGCQMRRLFALPEVLEMLSMSRTQAYREMATGRLAFIQHGRHRVFEPEAIDAFIASLKATEGVDLLVDLIDEQGRIDVARIPEGTTLADLDAAKRILADRSPSAA